MSKKIMVFVLVTLLAGSLTAWAQDEDDGPAPQILGAGVCIGDGSGLMGGYVKIRPADIIGFQANAGVRLFMINDDVYFPFAAAAKVQLFFMGRNKRFQIGVEGGGLYTEDQGFGGEVSAVGVLRMGKLLHLDFVLGAGYFPDALNQTYTYGARVSGLSRSTLESMELLLGDPSFVIFWGIGLSFNF